MYTQEQRAEIQARICRGIAAGFSIKKCREQMPDLPAESLIFQWLTDDDGFSEQYARARTVRADARAERIDDVVDQLGSGKIDHNTARVMIDAEKWQAGKENAKRYGDRLALDADVNVNLSEQQLESRLAQLLGKAGVAVSDRGKGTPEEAA